MPWFGSDGGSVPAGALGMGFSLGDPVVLQSAGATFANYTFVNATDQIEYIVQVPDPGAATVPITRAGYRLQSVTGVSPQMKISLQGVDANGIPDGVIKGGGAPASALFTPAGSITWNWVTLDNPYTAARGEFLAVVLSYNAGLLNGANTPVITMTLSIGDARGFPYAIQNVAGVRTRQLQPPVMAIGSTTQPFFLPLQTSIGTTFSATNERALRFIVPPGVLPAFRVAGFHYVGITPAAAKTVKGVLYQGTTALQTVTWDSDHVVAPGVTREVTLTFQDAALVSLQGGVEYRIGIQPQDAATNIALQEYQFANVADMEALPMGGTWYLSTRAAGGATAWTDVLTTRPLLAPILAR